MSEMMYIRAPVSFKDSPVPISAEWNRNDITDDTGSVVFSESLHRKIAYEDGKPDFATNIYDNLAGTECFVECCGTMQGREPRSLPMTGDDQIDWATLETAEGLPRYTRADMLSVVTKDPEWAKVVR